VARVDSISVWFDAEADGAVAELGAADDVSSSGKAPVADPSRGGAIVIEA